MQPFNVLKTPLNNPGFHLIEASAGSGKTYSISFIVLRLIAEQQIDPHNISITTFTRSATAQLRQRIRTVLYQSLHALEHGNCEEETINNWVEQLDDKAHHQALQAVYAACQQLENFVILSNDGLFQYLIRSHIPQLQYVLNNDDPVDESQITPLINRMLYEKSYQQWAQQSTTAERLFIMLFPYPDTSIESIPLYLKPLKTKLPSVDTLRLKIVKIIENTTLFAEFEPIVQQIAQHQGLSGNLKGVANRLYQVVKFFAKITNFFPQNFTIWLDRDAKYTTLLPLIVTKHKPEATQIIAPFAAHIAQLTELHALIVQYKAAQRQQWFESMEQLCYQQMIEQEQWSYASVQYQLFQHLEQNSISPVNGVFKHIIVDEFQDSNPRQWYILKRLLHKDGSGFLIGDPKQAIYRFRAADLSVYFAAKQQCSQHYHLASNWRSQPQLVLAVNQIFDQDNSFAHPQMEFQSTSAKRPQENGTATFVAWFNEQNELAACPADGAPNSALQQQVIKQCKQAMTKGITATDIMILVGTNAEAHRIYQSLSAHHIPATLQRSHGNNHYLRRMLWLVECIERSTQNSAKSRYLFQHGILLQPETISVEMVDKVLNALPAIYQTRGILGVWRYLLATTPIAENWQNFDDAVGLDFIQHCCAHLQQTFSENATKNSNIGDNSAQLKKEIYAFFEHRIDLATQAGSVRVLTYHGAKGLEASVVICPYLIQKEAIKKGKKQSYYLVNDPANGALSVDLLKQQEQSRQQEQLAEDLRQCYVALTRACDQLIVFLYDFGDTTLSGLLHYKDERLKSLPEWQQRWSEWQFNIATDELIDDVSIDAQSAAKAANLEPIIANYTQTSFTAFSRSHHFSPTITATDDLPIGAESGNVIHQALEVLLSDNEQLENFQRAPHEHTVFIENLLIEHGIDKQLAALFIDNINQIIQLQIPVLGANLHTLASTHPICCEMSFNLFLSQYCSSQQLATKSKQFPSQWALSPPNNALSKGLFNGFIDLVIEINNRYWIIDYKTNTLEGYDEPNLQSAMQHNDYGWQASFYLLALHRYLQRRLPGYSIENNLGGAIYLFVRGIKQTAGNGIYTLPTDLSWIQHLDKIIGTTQQ